VRGEDERGLQGTVDFAHQFQNGVTGLSIEVGGRLVRQNDGRLHGQRARNRNTLTLATRKFVGPVVHLLTEPDHVKKIPDPPGTLFLAHFGQLEQRVLDILVRRENRQQIEGLEDESDGTGTQPGQFVRRLAGHILSVDQYLP
jgi:hypothetical protein